MTINNRTLNERLSNLETNAEKGDALAEDVTQIIQDSADYLMKNLLETGIKANNCDGIRNLEVAMYEYILDSNPELARYFVYAESQPGELPD